MTPAEFIANETPNFTDGQIIVVSGPDSSIILNLLLDSRDAIRTAGRNCLDPIDTRMTIVYPDGFVLNGFVPRVDQFQTPGFVQPPMIRDGFRTITFISGVNLGQTRSIKDYDQAANILTLETVLPTPPAIGDAFVIDTPVERAFKFEWYFVTYRADGPMPSIILVSNQFDREDSKENPFPANRDIDVIRDLVDLTNVKNIPFSFEATYGSKREIFPFVAKIYYFDTRNDRISFIT